jgi:hypothetical protein
MEAMLRYRGRVVSAADIEQIRRLIAQHPTASRRALSHKLCAAWNWVQPNGALRDMVCRGLMLELHRAGLIELPPQRRRPHNPLAERQRPEPVSIDTTPLRARLAEIQPLAFRLVRRTAEEPLFNGLIERYHYLGYTQPVGEHLKYLIYGRGRPLACLAWSSAPRHLGPRDRFIGWSAAARRHNIHLVAYNPRFLVLPWIEVAPSRLASSRPHGSAALRRLGAALPPPDLLCRDLRRSRAISRHVLPRRELDRLGPHHGPRQGRAHQAAQSSAQGGVGVSAREALS